MISQNSKLSVSIGTVVQIGELLVLVENLELVEQHLGTLLFPASDGSRVLPRDCPIDLESCLTTSNQLLLRSYRFGQVSTYRHSIENVYNFSLSLVLERST